MTEKDYLLERDVKMAHAVDSLCFMEQQYLLDCVVLCLNVLFLVFNAFGVEADEQKASIKEETHLPKGKTKTVATAFFKNDLIVHSERLSDMFGLREEMYITLTLKEKQQFLFYTHSDLKNNGPEKLQQVMIKDFEDALESLGMQKPIKQGE